MIDPNRPPRLYKVGYQGVYGPGGCFWTGICIKWAYDAADAVTQATIAVLEIARTDKNVAGREMKLRIHSVEPHHCAGCFLCRGVEAPVANAPAVACALKDA